METPILFLVFNRPSLTQRVFDEIKKAKPKKLYVAIDGPRKGNQFDLENIEEVIKIVSEIKWDCDFKILKRENNLGCGVAISKSINWFFSNVEEGIILEDDCVPSQDFFFFCESMLEKYRNDSRIMAINGSNPLGHIQVDSTYFYSKYNFVWGWATWKRAWDFYEFDLTVESNFQRRKNLLKSFKYDLVSVRSWYKHLDLVKNGKINTWDYQWMYTCWKKNGFTITPKSNLVCNIGNELDPTHGVVDASYLNLKQIELIKPIHSPKRFRRNLSIDKKIARYRFGNYFFYFLREKLLKTIRLFQNSF
jgi:hypothetical protein